MKKLLSLFTLQLVLFFAYAGVLDNKKIKVNNNDTSDYMIVPMPDNGYLVVSHDPLLPVLIRMSSQNQMLWSKTFDFPNNSWGFLYDAGVLADSGIYLIYGKYDTSSYDLLYATIKLNAQGVVQWTTEVAFPLDDMYSPSGVGRPQPDGGLIFVPSLGAQMAAVKLNANGSVASSYIITPDTTLSSKNPGFDAESTDDGGLIIIGKNENDPVITRIAPNGTAAWMLYFSCEYYNRPYSIINTSDGNYLVGGLSYEEDTSYHPEAWLMKINPSGNILWSKRYSAMVDSFWYSYLAGFSQIVENPDGSITAFALDEDGQSYYAGIVVTLDASGQPLSGFAYPLYGSYYYAFSRIYKTPDNRALISTWEYDSLSGFTTSTLIDAATLSDYCMANPLSITTTVRPAVTHLQSNNVFVGQTLAAPTHPVITTRDTAITVTTKVLCGITGLQEIAAATDFSLFPNPASASDIITLKSEIELPASQILIHHISGRLVKQLTASSTGEVSFSINGLLPGLYFAEVLNGRNEKLGVKKLMVAE